MTAIFEKLFELVQAFWNYLVPWAVLGDDQCGLIRRLGKYRRDMRPGLNWKLPIFEQAMSETSALDSTVLREQSLTTSDGAQITLRGVLTWRVINARQYILDCGDAQSVVNDVGCGVIAEIVPDYSAEEILQGDVVLKKLRDRVRTRAEKWGVRVEYFGLVDRVRARTYRIITGDRLPP